MWSLVAAWLFFARLVRSTPKIPSTLINLARSPVLMFGSSNKQPKPSRLYHRKPIRQLSLTTTNLKGCWWIQGYWSTNSKLVLRRIFPALDRIEVLNHQVSNRDDSGFPAVVDSIPLISRTYVTWNPS
ncbi:hypothetical protein BU25DRAFT_204317 [Macroventuria anomochaeta]|uniref:Uncharacterized protein n=1 Tax=Macroventuria anomochaeta TaxID=301207 RepID=A0ACB6RN14_9PLEO|nr:uncharacterized protein BU25DRAFT_204317 [Macroventuria anomochaeta]KAF2622692.1 hypothetical protein BU25DRAFT_204317 [Macroventuria anomochaeta]